MKNNKLLAYSGIGSLGILSLLSCNSADNFTQRVNDISGIGMKLDIINPDDEIEHVMLTRPVLGPLQGVKIIALKILTSALNVIPLAPVHAGLMIRSHPKKRKEFDK